MLIHSKLTSSLVNGPGYRAVIHTQGCILGCPGCWNPQTHSFTSGEWIKNSTLIDWILGLKDTGIEGVTFSGGEPIHQIESIWYIWKTVKSQWPTATLGMFTGYSLRELEEGNYKRFLYSELTKQVTQVASYRDGNISMWKGLTQVLDWAIMGRYVKTLPSTNPMCGSSNQEIMLFKPNGWPVNAWEDAKTAGYRYDLNDFKPQQMEVQISNNGDVEVTGFPTFNIFQDRSFEERIL